MQRLTGMNAEKPKAVVLLSGGMDSCVTAAIASRTHQIAALHASYDQRTERRELESFHKLADHFRAFTRLTVRLDYFAAIGGSSLTDKRMVIHDADLRHTTDGTGTNSDLILTGPARRFYRLGVLP